MNNMAFLIRVIKVYIFFKLLPIILPLMVFFWIAKDFILQTLRLHGFPI